MTDYATGRDGAREDLCRYLAACYYEPSRDFVEEGLFDSMLAAASALDADLAASARLLGESFAAQDLQTLLVDYTALFIGPSQPRAMPYASFWLTDDQSLRHEATMAVLDFYEQGGLDVSDEFRELPDHVAVELEFLYLLIFSQNQARLAGNAGEPGAADALHDRFVGGHLLFALSVMILVLTGMSAFYAETGWAKAVMAAFGRPAPSCSCPPHGT